MSNQSPTCPMTPEGVIDRYFMEHRAKLIDIAAFLDRLDRSGTQEQDDYRMSAFREAITLLGDGKNHRAKRILELFSDPTQEPIASAAHMKGAYGAYDSRGQAT